MVGIDGGSVQVQPQGIEDNFPYTQPQLRAASRRSYGNASITCVLRRMAIYLAAFNRWKCVDRPAPVPGYIHSAMTLGLATTSLNNKTRGMSAKFSNR